MQWLWRGNQRKRWQDPLIKRRTWRIGVEARNHRGADGIIQKRDFSRKVITIKAIDLRLFK